MARMVRLAVCLAALLFSLAAVAQGKPILVGVALSQTGFLADLAAGMRDALLLWRDAVNAAGGLLGRPVELKVYDDASEAARTARLYELLIKEDGAELLIGPFGSAATSMAAGVAERSRRVMLNATGAAPGIHKRAMRYVFQVPPPADEAAAGLLPMAAQFGMRSLLVTAGNEAGAQRLIEQLRHDAQSTRITLLPAQYYVPDPLTHEFLWWATRLKTAGADILATPADARRSADLLRALRIVGYAPKAFVSASVTDPDFVRRAGRDAEYVLGPSPYEPAARTAGNAEFVKAYLAKYKTMPDFYAACAWASARLLEAAANKAGSLDQEALRRVLATLATESVLGSYNVNADGAQLGAKPFVVQILQGRREVVWPARYRSAAPVLPMPDWRSRTQPKS